MQRVIAWGPIAFAVRLGLTMVLLLMMGSCVAGVHTFPVRYEDRGFWFEPHWSLMFVVVFPALFGGLVHMIPLMRDAVARLTSERLRVITKGGAPAADFESYLATRLSSNATLFSVVCASLAILLTFVHGYSLFIFVLSGRGAPIVDWSTMFSVGAADPVKNLIFDLLAYSIEAVVIFIGFFFVLKFWLFLSAFSRTFRDDRTGYEFQPLVYDPDRRLGLRPLGAFMNLYLSLVIVFELYILGRRLQLIGKHGQYSITNYLTTLFDGARSFRTILNQDLYQWHTIDAGLWALLIFLTLPLVVGAYFPLWTLRRYVRGRRDDLWSECARAYEGAKEAGDEAEAQRLLQRMNLLQHTQLWPNGDARGWRLLTLSVAIGLAAWAPPFCVWLLAVGSTIEFGKWLVGLRATLGAPAH